MLLAGVQKEIMKPKLLLRSHFLVLSMVGFLDVLIIVLSMPQMPLTVIPYHSLRSMLAGDRPKPWQSPEQIRA